MYVALYITMGLWLSLLYEVWMVERRLRRRYSFAEDEYHTEERRFPVWLWPILAFLLLLIGFAHGCRTMAVPMHIYLIWAIILRGVSLWVVHELTDEKAFLQKLPGWSIREKAAAALLILSLLIVTFLWPSFYFRTVGYLRAGEMRDAFGRFEYASVEMFPEVEPEDLRVTTSRIAKSITDIRKSSAASWITGVHLGMYEGALSWISTVSETPWLGMLVGGSNRIKEAIIVPVNDPVGERAVTVPMKMKFAEGLWWDRGIFVHATDVFPLRTFTRGYVTSHGEDVALVTTSYFEIPFAAFLVDPKVHVWDPGTGRLLAEYSPQKAPEWVVQKWDERYVEILGDNFGDFRWTSENDLYYWNGIPRPSDRSADPSEPEGLRYQLWDGELTGVYLFHNKMNPSILEFIILVKHDELLLYSVDHLSLISPDEAKSVAVSGLPPLERGEYRTPIALLYRVGSKLHYHVPVYQYYEVAGHRLYLPIYFALVNARDRSLIREVVGEHKGALVGAIETTYAIAVRGAAKEVNGTLIKKYDPIIVHGETRQWLTIEAEDGARFDVLVKFELLETEEEMFKVVSMALGDPISVVVDKENVVLEVL